MSTEKNQYGDVGMHDALKNACDRLQSFLDTFGDLGDCVTDADLNDWRSTLALRVKERADKERADIEALAEHLFTMFTIGRFSDWSEADEKRKEVWRRYANDALAVAFPGTAPQAVQRSVDPKAPWRCLDCGGRLGPDALARTQAESAAPDPEVFRRLLRTAQLLQQNSEGCAVKHHGLNFEQQGLPGWLADTQKAIDEAARALTGPDSEMFKCNCPHEVRSGCSEPKCPHYAPLHPSHQLSPQESRND